jgi:hypothetical protein
LETMFPPLLTFGTSNLETVLPSSPVFKKDG